MAETEQLSVVSDAGPIIHLDELGVLGLLKDLGEILIPAEVWIEVLRHRPKLAITDVPNGRIIPVTDPPAPRLLALINSLGLDEGEAKALVLLGTHQKGLFLCDDAAARLAAESLGFLVHGTIGILIRAIRKAVRSRQEIASLLRRLPEASTLHISGRLLDDVIKTIEQAPD